MDNQDAIEELVEFFKALADANRLKIVGLLANQPQTVEQLAAILGLSASTISHHLAKLAESGLVSANAEGYYSVYHLNQKILEEKSRRLLARDALPGLVADVDAGAFDRKVIHDYRLPDGSFKTLPAQRKKLEAILRFIVQSFTPDQRYPEKQVNEILTPFYADTATLRRELIGNRLMQREHGEYWRGKEERIENRE